MKRIFYTAILSCITACSVSVPRYNVLPTIKQSHEEVMTEDYPTKKSVFLKFGTPTNKETFENIENWYFKLSEVTNSSTVGFSSGLGRITQDPMNPYVRIVDRALLTQQTQVTNLKTNSTTVETYVKFWFVNDSVTKWETFGVDYSRQIPNPNYDAQKGIAWEKAKTKQQKQARYIAFGTLSFGFIVFFTLLFAGS